MFNLGTTIREIVDKMSIEEKVAQLLSVPVEKLLENGDFSEAKAEKIIKHGIGQITRVAGSKLGLKPKLAARIVNKIQRFLLEKTRLGIPAIVHEECLSGLMAPTASAFPIPLALASTWDPDIVRRVAEAIRSQALAVGARQCLSPVLDLCRDPRWGRCEETFGEDPYLTAAIGVAYIEGLQGREGAVMLMATAKHFAAHGIPEGGRNTAPVNIGVRELRYTHLYPFEAAVKIAKVKAVMPAYHEIDGVPCHANAELLTQVLRLEWGFDGIVVSDYGGVRRLHSIHKVARSPREASILALSAGVDIELPDADCFPELVNAVNSGEIPETLIDKAVERVIYIKYALGLFNNPFVDEEAAPESLDGPLFRGLAREAARESIILLKNDGVLPLPKKLKSIAVIGSLASDPLAMLGDYHYATHMKIPQPDIHVVTVLEGIENKVGPSTNVLYAEGYGLRADNAKFLDEARRVASQADVVLVVVGDRSCIFDTVRCSSGEGVDSSSVSVDENQAELVKTLSSLGKPMVLIVLAGRPMSIENIQDYVNAVIWCWKLGMEGGNALADILFGDYSPSGRLPVSLPSRVGHIPVYYARKPSSFGDYIEGSSKPLYPFGYGLSYTKFSYRNLAVEPRRVPVDGRIKVSVEVENTGMYRGAEVVQLYISRSYSETTLPAIELKAFKKIVLDPGERRRISFVIPTELLAYYGKDLKLVITPGDYKAMIGKSAGDIVLEEVFSVIGTRREVLDRRTFFAEIFVE